jgi:hypothetical protein
MGEHLKRNLLFGLAAGAVVAAVLISLATGGGHDKKGAKAPAGGARARGDQQLAAEYLGLSSTELRRRLGTGESMAEIAAATHGKSAAGLQHDLLEHRKAAIASSGDSPAREQEALSRARVQVSGETSRTHGRKGLMQVAAVYLGVSETSLRASLRAGKSLAELATAHGRSTGGLIDALVALKVKRLRLAARQGVISSAEAQTALKSLHKRVANGVLEHRRRAAG